MPAGDCRERRIENQQTIRLANLFVADYDSILEWDSLLALGKTITETDSSGDFDELDSVLGMTNFTDSINETYIVSGQINETDNFTIFSITLSNF